MTTNKNKANGRVNYARSTGARLIGRDLSPAEHVVFRDGDRGNVTVDNVMVFANVTDVRRWRRKSKQNVGLTKRADGVYTYDEAARRIDRLKGIHGRSKSPSRASLVAYLQATKQPSFNSVATNFDIPIIQVRALLNKYNLVIDQFASDGGEREALLKMISSGATLQSVMNKYRISRTALNTRLKWFGINVDHGRVTEVKRVEIPADVMRLAVKYLSIHEIADKLGTYPAVISELGQRYGLNVRRARRYIIRDENKFSREEILAIVDYGKTAGINTALDHFMNKDGRYTYWSVKRALSDAEAFIEHNELTVSERTIVVDTLQSFRDQALAGDERLATVDAAAESPDTSTVRSAAVEATDKQPGRRIAKRDLSALMATGVGVQRVARIVNVDEVALDNLARAYHIDLEAELAPVKAILTPASITVFRQAGRSPREVANFLNLKPAIVRLLMHLG